MANVPGSCLERLIAFTWYGIIVSLWLGTIGFFAEFFHKMKRFDYQALPKRTGQTVVITGGARGIGFVVLTRLLQLDYHVVLGVRNPDAGFKAVEKIRKSGVNSGSVQCIQLDLKSLKSVRTFANDVLQQTDKIHLLINNAGIMFEPFELTEDGYEAQFQVNYLSHFLLTNLLLQKIKATGSKSKINCRIINVSSLAHRGSQLKTTKDLANPKFYSAFRQYYDSKLCQVLSTKYLDAKLKSEGAKVNVYALHPGIIPTGLYSSLKIFGEIAHTFKMFFRNTEGGAEIVMHTVLSPTLENEGGSYISNQKIATTNPIAEDLALQKELWDMSQALTKQKR